MEDIEVGKKKEKDQESHGKGEYVKSVVYAGLDAIVTSFSLISFISATQHSSDGISMGLGNYMSSSTEKDVAAKEKSVTEWDVTNHSDSQRQELVQKYHLLGMDINDATMYKNILVDEKMTTEKRLTPPDEEGRMVSLPFDMVKFIGACFMALLALAVLGIAKAKITKQNHVWSVAISVRNGAFAAVAAYALGWTLRNVANLED
ncbi:unnamed protein product [Dovyalis caffra]|uniref:Vacuolar iron transporter n=1 Tax=Dovyalis caffra TaxID=77055 RepID=A0AAV1S9I2_9ROSI|nr:unnamed protein product [Dovyalis caffra]